MCFIVARRWINRSYVQKRRLQNRYKLARSASDQPDVNKKTKWAILSFKSGCHSCSCLSVCLFSEQFISFRSRKNHEALEFIAPCMSHQAFIDAEVVPGNDGGIDTNNAIFESGRTTSVISISNLVKLGESNGLVDRGRLMSTWIFSSFSLTSI